MIVTLCASSEIPRNGRKFYDIDGESVAILDVEGKLYAIRNTCPHMGGPVGEGKLVRRPTGNQNPVSRFQTFSPAREAVVGERSENRGEETTPPTISCPWHVWEFALNDGTPSFPAKRGATTYEVWVEDGLVKLDLDPKAPNPDRRRAFDSSVR